MERREFVALAATAAIVTPTLAEAKKADGPDYRKVFDLKEEDRLLGIAFCHEGDALTEDDRWRLDGILAWRRPEGPSQLAERIHKIAVLSDVESLLKDPLVSIHTGVLIEMDRALASFSEGMRKVDVASFDALLGGHALLNKEHKRGVMRLELSGWGEVVIPHYNDALCLKKRFRGMALWTRPLPGWDQG